MKTVNEISAFDDDRIGKGWEGAEPEKPNSSNVVVHNRTVNINIQPSTSVTGAYDTQGCCTEHQAPCAGQVTTCTEK